MRLKVHPKKALGQHWLHDQASLESICNAAEVDSKDTVLEIGPGLGTLTEILVKKAKRVIAVEFDDHLAAELPKRISASNLEVINQDILHFDFSSMPAGYKVVANIPYYLTSNLIRVMSETFNPPSRAALLVQKEVAERAAAKPNDMSLLAVTAQFYWRVSLGDLVPAHLFTPPPKVDSRVLKLERRRQPLLPDLDSSLFFRLVRAGFSQRRKTLLNSLSAGLRMSRNDITGLCEAAGINPQRRAQTLSMKEWGCLYRSLDP